MASPYAATASEAVDQLRRLLKWRETQDDGTTLSEFDDPQLSFVELEIRPEYPSDTGAFPCDDLLRLRVPYVRGQMDSQTMICVLPTLESWFFFHVGDRVDRHADPSNLALRFRRVGVVAQLRRKVEGDREAGLPLLEEVAVARIRLARGRKTGVLTHRPGPSGVHRGVDPARERVLAREADVAEVIGALEVGGGVHPARLGGGGAEGRLALREAAEDALEDAALPFGLG